MSDSIKAELRRKAREKPPDPVLMGEAPLGEVRVLPDPEAQRIDGDRERTLHSIICRAGYQRNVHRTEGVSWRRLYDELRAFFLGELVADGTITVEVSEEGSDRVDEQGPPAPGPEGPPGDPAGAAAAADAPGEVQRGRGDAAGPKRGGRGQGRQPGA